MMIRTGKSVYMRILFIIIAALIQWIVMFPGDVYGWGATTVGLVNREGRVYDTFGTHQFILKEAYKDLQSDPAYFKGSFLPLTSILEYEGNTILTGGSGPGPDAEGGSPWSWHYYNPRFPGTNKGQAPARVKKYATDLILCNRINPKAACWSVHFLADMFTPVHMNMMPAEEIIKIYNEQTDNGKNSNPVYIGTEITGPEGGNQKDWRQEVERFLKAKKETEAKGNKDLDIFEVWYWDYSGKLPPSTLNASHARWEQLNPKHQRISNLRTYDPNWSNGVPSFDNADNVYAQQAEQVAIRAARETVDYYVERKFTNPQLALQRAIEAVYTLWRASFSALNPVIKIEAVKDMGNRRTYEISGVVNNFAQETAKDVVAKLWYFRTGYQTIFMEEQKIGDVNGNRANKATPRTWQVTVDVPGPNEETYNLVVVIEAIGRFQNTPDLQYAIYKEEIKVEAAAVNPMESVVVTFELDKGKNESGGDINWYGALHLPNQDGLRLEEGMPLLADGTFKGEMAVYTNAGKQTFQLNSTLNGRVDKNNSNVSFKGECIIHDTTIVNASFADNEARVPGREGPIHGTTIVNAIFADDEARVLGGEGPIHDTTIVNPTNKAVTTEHFLYEGLGAFSNASSPEIRNNPPGFPAGGGQAKLTMRKTIQQTGKESSTTNYSGRLPFKLRCFCSASAPPAPAASAQPSSQPNPPAPAVPAQPSSQPGVPPPPGSTVTKVSGNVKVSTDSDDTVDVKKGAALPAGKAVEIRTGDGGGITVRMPAGGTLIVPPSSVVRIEADARVILKQGAVDGDITEAAGSKRITVVSPVAQITDDGTKFHIDHDPKRGITMVCVTEGAVRVQPTKPGSAPLRVVAGQQIEVSETGILPTPNPSPEAPSSLAPVPSPEQKDTAATDKPAPGAAQSPTLILRTPSVKRGKTVAVVHSKFPASTNAWIALYKKGAASDDYICYTFLANLTDRIYDVSAPEEPGIYEFRVFADEGYIPAAVSAPVEVK